ncbi:thiamine pyrophosphate-dependent dehydrogenase E1 component subunit alpha [Alphaproteobacteria bacterium]|nr:thiamine pyrophosphate-dependent dehydrogenase E1 component subunit alpha [Alphaproteobacteria bacterium]
MSASIPPNLDIKRYLNHHKMMNKIRAFEETAAMANEEGLVLGAIHLSIGQESIASGVCQNLEKDDFLLSTHRGHGHTLAKGANPQSMMLELLGRKGGICRGKGGSMHIADVSVGMLGANGVVSANINIAAGAGHAIKLKGGNNISCCIFGDGAINRGPFLEGLNWAGVFRLPVLFVCEKNGFASTTATEAMTSGAGSKDRAESLGIPSEEIDGNDIVAVDECVRKNINEIRSGGGPRFILCNTYRLHGHTASDPALYRDQKDVDEAWKNDPIANCKELLKNAGVIEKDLTGHRDDALAEMRKIYDSAKRAPWPDLQLAYEDVQDSGDPRERAY